MTDQSDPIPPLSTITDEQAMVWLANRAILEQEEDKQIYDELVAYAARRGREICAVIQPLGGGLCIATWGVQRKHQ